MSKGQETEADDALKADGGAPKSVEAQLRAQRALLNAINKVFREALTCETEEEVARTCLAVAEELTGSKFGFVGEVNEAGRFDAVALSDPGWDACQMPKSDAVVLIRDMEIRGLWAGPLKDGRSCVVNDPGTHPDRVGTPEGHPPLTSFLGIPLRHQDKTIGMIALANKESGYDSVDRESVEALSTSFVEALMRKRAEEALRKARDELEVRVRERTAELANERDLLNALMDNIPDMIYFKDSRSCFIRVNNAVAGAFGMDNPEQVVGKTDSDFFSDAYARQEYEEEQEVMRSRRPVVGKMDKEVWPNGRSTWSSTTKLPLCDRQGDVVGTCGISRPGGPG